MERVDMVLMTRVCQPCGGIYVSTILSYHILTWPPWVSCSKYGLSIMSDGPLGTYATVKVCSVFIGYYVNLSDCVQHLHKIVPAFIPYVPVGVLSYLAFILLTATFGLTFYFTTYVIFILSRISFNLSAVSQNQQSLCVRR